ncbi:MAG: hypothetical protein PHO37_04795 [Kiritimatiellae bacterium]|nr:hypothetical protein [Kiritimatiellia bacterium]
MATTCLLALTAAAGIPLRSESHTPPPFARYAPILERMPFGKLPEKFGETVDPNAAKQALLLKAEQQKLASRVNMSAVNITPQGATAIGFTDLSAKPPVSYYLLVGSEAGGWKVNSADYDAETAEIEKDGVSISLQLGKGMIDNPPAPAAPAKNLPVNPALTAQITPSPPVRAGAATSPPRPPEGSSGSSVSATSIRDKLRAAQAAQVAAQQASGSDSESDNRSYMERLRERKIEQAKALEQAQSAQRQQLEKLAREVASKEIEKQAAIAEETALERELVLEEERLQKEEAERLEKEDEKETPAP